MSGLPTDRMFLGRNCLAVSLALVGLMWVQPTRSVGQQFDGGLPGQSSPDQQVSRHLVAGEFSAATRIAGSLPVDQRDRILSQIGKAQGYSGETSAAGRTISSITSSWDRSDAVGGLGGGAGGASFADFAPLIQLIQTTIVPDTWDLLGGPSTMSEYAQGVFVDAAGTVQSCETMADPDAAENLKSLLLAGRGAAAFDAGSWKAPSTLRCVSLRRLLDEGNRRRINGIPPSEAMLYLGGISRVQYLFVDQERNDIILAGPVGGIEMVDGIPRDRETGTAAMRHDFLATCMAAASSGEPFGCTIDPSIEGLARAASVGAKVKNDDLPIGKAAEALVEAIGMQSVEVFGAPGDTPIGYLMVEADRHMKELALGVHPMPRGAKNYLDITEATIDRGPPTDLLLRLWFTASPVKVTADGEKDIFEISGMPIRLSGQNERAMADGARGNLTRDFRSEMFVADFNEHFDDIRRTYPVYGALEAVYRAASVAELVKRFADDPGHQSLVREMAASSSTSVSSMPVPRQIETIAVLHNIRDRGRRHHILIASGGVSVRTGQTLVSTVVTDPGLKSMANTPQARPTVADRWWWDAR